VDSAAVQGDGWQDDNCNFTMCIAPVKSPINKLIFHKVSKHLHVSFKTMENVSGMVWYTRV